jgi:ABC-type phosphate transport system substrate-binding protein
MRLLCSIILTALFLGCSTEEKESATKGKLHVSIPESLAPVMVDEVNEFLRLYQAGGASITDTIVSAEIVARRFVRDTARIAFLPRPLTPEEKQYAKSLSPDLNEQIVAYDGIVAIVNSKNKTDELTTTKIQHILSGTITQWEQVSKSLRGSIKIYCQDSSDVTEYLKQRLLHQADISAKLNRSRSDVQTLRFVEKDPLAIGFIALGWLDSSTAATKTLNIGRTSDDTDTSFASPAEAHGNFFSPHPANLYRNYYPLKRAIYMYSRGTITLATGFGTYVATSEGQKIFLKHGLLPGTQRIKLKANEPS